MASPTFAAPAAPAVGPQAEDPKLARAFTALEDEYDEAYEEWRQAYMAASREHRKLRATNPNAPFDGPERIEPTYFPRFDRLAQAGSAAAKTWCLAHFISDAPADQKRRDFTRRAMDVMLQQGVDHSMLPRAIMGSSRGFLGVEPAQSLLHVLELTAENPSVAAEAAYMHASLQAPGRSVTPAQMAARLDGYRRVAASYPDQKYGKRADGAVFKEEHLQIGMVAPDIVGKDVDGNDMKLSDFRGKVTVLDFWGFW